MKKERRERSPTPIEALDRAICGITLSPRRSGPGAEILRRSPKEREALEKLKSSDVQQVPKWLEST